MPIIDQYAASPRFDMHDEMLRRLLDQRRGQASPENTFTNATQVAEDPNRAQYRESALAQAAQRQKDYGPSRNVPGDYTSRSTSASGTRFESPYRITDKGVATNIGVGPEREIETQDSILKREQAQFDRLMNPQMQTLIARAAAGDAWAQDMLKRMPGGSTGGAATTGVPAATSPTAPASPGATPVITKSPVDLAAERERLGIATAEDKKLIKSASRKEASAEARGAWAQEQAAQAAKDVGRGGSVGGSIGGMDAQRSFWSHPISTAILGIENLISGGSTPNVDRGAIDEGMRALQPIANTLMDLDASIQRGEVDPLDAMIQKSLILRNLRSIRNSDNAPIIDQFINDYGR